VPLTQNGKFFAVANKEPPFVFTVQFSPEAGTALGVARANRIRNSDIIRSALDLWLRHHQWLMGQGHTALSATDYLLAQTEAKPAQPMPQPAPMPSPFAQMPINGPANGR